MASETIDRDEARAWLARWKEVNAFTAAEDRAMTPEEKLRQLQSLMQSADLFDWTRPNAEDEVARKLWMRLHELDRC